MHALIHKSTGVVFLFYPFLYFLRTQHSATTSSSFSSPLTPPTPPPTPSRCALLCVAASGRRRAECGVADSERATAALSPSLFQSAGQPTMAQVSKGRGAAEDGGSVEGEDRKEHKQEDAAELLFLKSSPPLSLSLRPPLPDSVGSTSSYRAAATGSGGKRELPPRRRHQIWWEACRRPATAGSSTSPPTAGTCFTPFFVPGRRRHAIAGSSTSPPPNPFHRRPRVKGELLLREPCPQDTTPPNARPSSVALAEEQGGHVPRRGVVPLCWETALVGKVTDVRRCEQGHSLGTPIADGLRASTM